jgi:hypothetical protein
VSPLMSSELPQCSHVLLGMGNYSPARLFMTSRTVSKGVNFGTTCAADLSNLHEQERINHPQALGLPWRLSFIGSGVFGLGSLLRLG